MAPVIARVLDFETTGYPEDPESAICEVGFVDVDLTRPDFPLLDESAWSSLIDPGRPMPPETSAVHHLVDGDLKGMPAIEVGFRALGGRMTAEDVYCAHNARFEQAFFPNGNSWICTYKCALRAWPDAPGHSNQVLRYWLGLELDRDRAQPPHRALPDAYVTAHILRKLLLMREVDRLIAVSAEPGFLPTIGFGKHRGAKFRDVPTDYLDWIVNKSGMDPKEDEDVLFTAKYWLARR